MAFTFGPQAGGGVDESWLQYEDLMRRQAQYEQFALQQGGYLEQEKQLSLEEGLKQASSTLRGTYERTQAERTKVLDALQQYGVTADEAREWGQTGTITRYVPPTGKRNYIPEWIQAVKKYDQELNELETKIRTTTEFVKSPELLEQERIQKESLARQRELEQSIMERQLAAQRGELDLSPAAERKRQQQFETFKEAQARAGRIILGETPEEAIAKGTAAEQALSGFKEQLEASRESERQIAIGQAPQAFQAAQLAGTLAPQYFMPATTPTQPSLLGLQSLQTALQPFQFQQQLAMQRAMLEEQKAQSSRSLKTGLWGAGLGLLGSGLQAAGMYYGGSPTG